MHFGKAWDCHWKNRINRIQFLSSVSMLILLRMPNDHPLHLQVSISITVVCLECWDQAQGLAHAKYSACRVAHTPAL